MSRKLQPERLNMRAFAQDATPLAEATPLQKLPRVAAEANGLQADQMVHWEAIGELRPHTGSEDDVWLHLKADADVPLTCQRCMTPVLTPLAVHQTYRFVADEDIAMAEDDESEEDLLVMEPQFDLIALIEDELLMAMPLVPMHDKCPVTPVLSAGVLESDGGLNGAGESEKPNPFAVLAQLKKKS